MTREEAIRILASSCIPGSKQTEALETLIPELRESEDERIRKQLIDAIKIGRSNSGISFTEEAASRYIAWLEKQKEQKELPLMNDDADLYFDTWRQEVPVPTFRQCFEEGMRYAQRLQKEQKPVNHNFTTFHRDVVYCAMCDKNLDEGLRCNLEIVYKIIKDIVDRTPVVEEQKPAESISQLTVQGKGVYKICPRCKERMVRDDSMVYTSMPPQYRYECPKCGESECDTVMYDNPEMKEQKPSINIDQLKSLMLQYLQEAANEKDDLDIEADTDKWARKILGYDFEQKPVDLSEMMVHKEPYIAPVPTPMVADEQKSVDYEAELKKCKDNPLYFYDKYVSIKLKPAEWSEEDEAIRIEVIKLLSNPSLYEACEHLREESVDWLKTLHTKVNVNSEKVSANSEKVNVNWSEEDEEILNRIIETLSLPPIYDTKACAKMVSWLKSLRPSWKPSEEQMKALLNAEGKMREFKFIAIASKLADLYEDLKKLKEE